MKSFLFINHTGHLGGGESVFADVIRIICRDKNNSVYVVYPTDGDEHFRDVLKGFGVKKIKSLPYRVLRSTMLLSIRNFGFSLLAIPSLIYFCLKYNIDVICSNTSVNIVGLIIAKIMKKKHLWYIHELSTSHHRWTPRQLDKIYRRCFVSHWNYSVFVSQAAKDAWQRQVGCEIVRSEVLYSQYKNVEVNVTNRLSTQFTFGFLGGLNPNKNVRTLINAFSQIPGARLIIGGSGRMLASLIDDVKKNDCVRNVEFWGQIDDSSIFYSSIDVLVQISLNESWGLVALEGISAGKAVVMTKYTGLKEILRSEEGVVYVDPTDVDQISNEMKHLMNDAGYRNSVASKGIVALSMLDINNKFNYRINNILNEI